jgi:zinc/manganese transport system ATP-binding protein
MSTNRAAIIEADNLSVSFGATEVWREAAFKVVEGEFIGVLGPNGAGKSTLFKVILGLKQPSGELRVFNKPPRKGSPLIGYVPQRRNIDSDVRIETLEIVRLGLSGAKWGMGLNPSKEIELADAALKDVGAAHLAHRQLGVLSGGELQRVFLAQALVSRPKLLLLDEPLANLDIRAQADLVKLVNDISRKFRVAVLLIAHDLNPLLPVLDRIIYIANRKVASGKPHEVVNSKALSKLYGTPIEVLQDSRGRLAVLGIEEAAHHDE